MSAMKSIEIDVGELAHVELARRGATFRAVRLAVDHHPARAADALATIVVEGDRLLVVENEALIHQVEHLDERHVRAHAGNVVSLERTGRGGRSLPPGGQRDPKRLVRHPCAFYCVCSVATCRNESTDGRTRIRAAPCGAPAPCRLR